MRLTIRPQGNPDNNLVQDYDITCALAGDGLSKPQLSQLRDELRALLNVLVLAKTH